MKMNNRQKYNKLVKYIKKLYLIDNKYIYYMVSWVYKHNDAHNFIKHFLQNPYVNFNAKFIYSLYEIEKQSNYILIKNKNIEYN